MESNYYKLRHMSGSLLLVLLLSNYISPSMSRLVPLANKTSDTALANDEKKDNNQLQTYIVHVQQPDSTTFSTSQEQETWYRSFLPIDLKSLGETRLVYSYNNVVSGFAARLTEKELVDMSKKAGFLISYPDRILHLQTTYTPAFLGLNRETAGLWTDSGFGKGVIIGMLDTGVSPNHPSFGDEGMPPPPSKWTGTCEFNASDCNNRLIGARDFVDGLKAMGGKALQGPYDYDGHGTHTASTAAGMFVDNANVNDQANGTASGIAPYAHLAIYRVCSENSCAESDILAGIDNAVEDGVDVMSISIGGSSLPFYSDSIAIGTLGAIQKGTFVSCAAGNFGPTYRTLSNEAPWIFTVGASTMDRTIGATVVLGNNDELDGESLYQPRNSLSPSLPLVYPGALGTGSSDMRYCVNGSLDGVDVRGMVVLCNNGNIQRVIKGEVVKRAGGAGMIIANLESEGYTIPENAHVLPASHVSYSDGSKIKTYINSASSPTAAIAFTGTVIGAYPAPAVAYFSSRGPSRAGPNILKPDMIGPGVNVLAAWPFQVGFPNDAASTFNIISGTSMATPHLSGIAALLKSAHPDWSPAMIKSALMTSSEVTNTGGNPITDETLQAADFFMIGAGHANPTKATDPGLVYDIEPESYTAYLCGLRYRDAQVSAVTRRRISCSDVLSTTSAELNYPSFTVILDSSGGYTMEVARTVMNVGAASSAYTVQVVRPSGVSVTVNPTRLLFSKANEKVQFSVRFTSSSRNSGFYWQGSLTWVSSDKTVTVRSPLNVGVV